MSRVLENKGGGRNDTALSGPVTCAWQARVWGGKQRGQSQVRQRGVGRCALWGVHPGANGSVDLRFES